MRILFLAKYSRLGGSSRYMIYDYIEFFHKAGIDIVVSPLFDERYHQGIGEFARPTSYWHILKHSNYLISRVARQMRWVHQSDKFDVVVLEKELVPYLPYGLERLLKRRRTRLITYFDDAIHAYYKSHPNLIVRFMSKKKIERIIKLSDHVVVWNTYLGEYYKQFNSRVTVVNTGVDLRRYRLKDYKASENKDHVSIGWIGTPSSYPYIRSLEDVFGKLASRYPVELRIVSSMDYLSKNIKVDNRRWSVETEVNDLCSFDIGIMPLPNNEWTKGKSGCKAVQYLAVGIPAVCSPVGVAREILHDGVNGFLADTHEAWFKCLATLIENPQLRREQGQVGRRIVENTYSIQAIAPTLIRVLQEVGHNKQG
jgi:glycosyltransferase involved in cell wall biosynthesis